MASDPDCGALLAKAEAFRCPKDLLKEPRESKAPYVDSAPCPSARAYATDSPEGRAFLGLSMNNKCSDGVLWLPEPSPGRLVFVELKTSDFKEADEQLGSCIQAWKRKVSGVQCPASTQAVVILSGNVPSGFPSKQRRFRKQHKVTLSVLAGRKAKPDHKKPSKQSRRVLCSELPE